MTCVLHALVTLLASWVEAPSRWIIDIMDEADAVWDLSDPLLSGD